MASKGVNRSKTGKRQGKEPSAKPLVKHPRQEEAAETQLTGGGWLNGIEQIRGQKELFGPKLSYVSTEKRVPRARPLHVVKQQRE